MMDFENLTKIAQERGIFGQINCCQTLWKVAQSPKIAQSGHTAHKIHIPTWVLPTCATTKALKSDEALIFF